jgi:dynactin complex subunit
MKKEHLEILLEDIRGKFDLVLEGHEMLREEIRGVREESNARHDQTAFLLKVLNDKIDGVENRLNDKIDSVENRLNDKIDSVENRLNEKIDCVENRLSAKIDAVADNLADHRKDTEAHGGLWRVKEGGG